MTASKIRPSSDFQKRLEETSNYHGSQFSYFLVNSTHCELFFSESHNIKIECRQPEHYVTLYNNDKTIDLPDYTSKLRKLLDAFVDKITISSRKLSIHFQGGYLLELDLINETSHLPILVFWEFVDSWSEIVFLGDLIDPE